MQSAIDKGIGHSVSADFVCWVLRSIADADGRSKPSDHFVKDHAKGLVTKPYKCERCWKRHATPKQRNSHKGICRGGRPEESDDMKLVNSLLDQVEESTQTLLLITTEGVQNAMYVINDANQQLGILVPPRCARRRQQGSNPGTEGPPATGFSTPQSSPTPQPSASPPHRALQQMAPEAPASPPHHTPQQIDPEAPASPHHAPQQMAPKAPALPPPRPQQMAPEAPAVPANPGHVHHHHHLLPAQGGYYPIANPAPNNPYGHVYQPPHSEPLPWKSVAFPLPRVPATSAKTLTSLSIQYSDVPAGPRQRHSAHRP